MADRGPDPKDMPHCGLNYPDTRKAVILKQDARGNEVPTGYEMFPFKEPYDKSPEILAFEAFTGQPFVQSRNGDEWRFSWLETGENPNWARNAFFVPNARTVSVNHDYPQDKNPARGVRRLLKVKKV